MTTFTPPTETEIKPDARPLDTEVELMLRKTAVAKVRSDLLRLVLEIVALAFFTLLVPVLLDYRYFFSTEGRYAAEAAWGVLALLCLTRVISQWRKTATPKAVALEIERARPESHCEVSTASQYAGAPVRKPLDAEIYSALQARAATRLIGADSPYRRRFLLAVGALALGAALLAVVLSASPDSRLALQRILVPGARGQYTTVLVTPGDVEVAVGDTLDLTAKFSGRLSANPLIEWRSADGSWLDFPLTGASPDSFSFTMKNVRDAGTYRIRGNDALSPEYHLTIYNPPAIAHWTIDVVPPAYAQAGVPVQHNETGNITALRGSTLTWKLVPNVPLSQGGLQFKSDPALALKVENPAAPSTSWDGSMVLKEGTDETYHATLTDTASHPPHDSDAFHLVALPDAPPEVEISGLDENTTAGAQDKINFTVQADDDVALSDLKVVYQHPGSPDVVVSLTPQGLPTRHITNTQVLDLTPLNLQPYDVLMLYAEARDNNTLDGPGITRSSVYFITITNPNAGGDNGGGGGGGGGGEQINLMQLQRDLISGTTRLPDAAPRTAMTDLAAAQRQIKQYAAMFLASLGAPDAATEDAQRQINRYSGMSLTVSEDSPPDVTTAMNGAEDAMEAAAVALDKGDRPTAIPQEEKALAGLYQVLKALPPGTPMQGQPGKGMSISLDGSPPSQSPADQKNQDDLNDALAKANALANAQQQAMQNGQDPGQASKDEQALADQANALAAKLGQMAGSNPGLGQAPSQAAGDAAGQMQAAATGIAQGNGSTAAQVAERKSLDDLSKVIDALEKTLGSKDRNSDVSAETAPPEYQDQLNSYFEKLSHEK